MNTINVEISKKYSVIVGRGLIASIGTYIASIKNSGKIAIISDTNVWPLYGEIVCSSLSSAGFQTVHYIIEAGEQSKNGSNYLEILNFLANQKITRSDLLIALGGGVVGDITGFAAATYLRGIPYVQVPTTLLAMVDSSVGGKTAIDLPAGKNLAGAFYQPSIVICDPETLTTLPQEVFIDGCAEVIKYGVLYDRALFSHLAENGIHFDREMVISRCIELKRNVVVADEFDTGVRQQLNLGHTLGHSIEKLSNYAISHGKAVAIGMAIISRACARIGICADTVCAEICTVLSKFGLPTKNTYGVDDLYATALSDKKRTNNTINLVVPKDIGSCVIHNINIEELLTIIKAGNYDEHYNLPG